MLLTRLAKCGRDSGSALVAVIGVMAVGLILTTLIATQLVGAMGQSTAARAGVQSHASADAGIVAARTALFTPGSCVTNGGTYTTTVPPIYTVSVEYNAGAGWQPGCPTAAATQVRLLSTGTAQAAGVAGVSSGDKSSVEAVFQYITPGPPPSGVAMYLYGGAQVESNSSLDLSEGGDTGLIVKDGNFLCDKNNTVINGSILIGGDLTFAKTCRITGNAWVSGTATLGSGTIDGNLTAPSVSPNPPGTQVGGTWATSGPAPDAPDWVNVVYSPADWVFTNAGGNVLPWEVRTVSSTAECALPNGTLGGTTLGEPVIINALGCEDGPTATNNTTVKLSSDVVIFANEFSFDGINSLTFKSATTASHRLWFITPDNGAADDNLPTCDDDDQGNFTINNSFAIEAPLAALLYTPCAFDGKNGFTWRGQIYAGQYSLVKNNPVFTFVPVGAAGVDFTTGEEDEDIITKPQPGAVVSMRDVNGG